MSKSCSGVDVRNHAWPWVLSLGSPCPRSCLPLPPSARHDLALDGTPLPLVPFPWASPAPPAGGLGGDHPRGGSPPLRAFHEGPASWDTTGSQLTSPVGARDHVSATHCPSVKPLPPMSLAPPQGPSPRPCRGRCLAFWVPAEPFEAGPAPPPGWRRRHRGERRLRFRRQTTLTTSGPQGIYSRAPCSPRGACQPRRPVTPRCWGQRRQRHSRQPINISSHNQCVLLGNLLFK